LPIVAPVDLLSGHYTDYKHIVTRADTLETFVEMKKLGVEGIFVDLRQEAGYDRRYELQRQAMECLFEAII
jgi:hypothetical protein